MIQGVHHVAIISSSKESVKFYEKLGFKPFLERERQNDTIVLLYGHGIQIEMFIDPNHPPYAADLENMGLRHIALKVDNIEKTTENLGLTIGEIKKVWTGIRFAYTKDPDGLPVELHE